MVREMDDEVLMRANLGQLQELAAKLDEFLSLARACAAAGTRPTDTMTALAEDAAGAMYFLGVKVPEQTKIIDPLVPSGPLRLPVIAATGAVAGGVVNQWLGEWKVVLAGVRSRIRALQAAAAET
jgi:hypothetical protein